MVERKKATNSSLELDYDRSLVLEDALNHKNTVMGPTRIQESRDNLLSELSEHRQTDPDNPMIFSWEEGEREPRLGLAWDSLRLYVFHIYSGQVTPNEMNFPGTTELELAEEMLARFDLANTANLNQSPPANPYYT